MRKLYIFVRGDGTEAFRSRLFAAPRAGELIATTDRVWRVMKTGTHICIVL